MKYLTILFVFSFILSNAKGQNKSGEVILKEVDSLEFFGIKFKVPDGCKAESTGKGTYSVTCIGYHYNVDILDVTPPDIFPSLIEETTKKIEQQTKKFQKTRIIGYLGPDTLTGYRISCLAKDKMEYLIMAFKKNKHNAIFFNFYSDKMIENNADLPEPLNNIFRFSEYLNSNKRNANDK
jgi:hypothetical protein